MTALPDARQSNQLLTVDDVAAALYCSPRTVWRLIRAKQLPSVKVGRTRRVHTDDVAAYLDTLRRS